MAYGVWRYFTFMLTLYRYLSVVRRSRELVIGRDRIRGTGTTIACLGYGMIVCMMAIAVTLCFSYAER